MTHRVASISPNPFSLVRSTIVEADARSRSKSLTTNLIELSRAAPHLPTSIPPEVIEYVESGRNPDIYTREFVELVQKNNDHLRGKMLAFRGFRDVLADEISSALPELRDQVERVVQETGGRRDDMGALKIEHVDG